MSGFKETVEARNAKAPYRNKYEWLLKKLGPEDAAGFIDMLRDATISPAAIHEELLVRGYVDIQYRRVYEWALQARRGLK